MSSAVLKGRRFLLAPGIAIAALSMVALSGCERPPVETLQGGYRGLGMEQVINPRSDAKKAAANKVPDVIPAASGDGPLASSVYQNVQVLKDLNVAEFSRVMLAITQWVAPPDQSCNYCHGANMASDDRYTKVVVAAHVANGASHQLRLEGSRRRHGCHLLHLPSRQRSTCQCLVHLCRVNPAATGSDCRKCRTERAVAGSGVDVAAVRSVHPIADG